jgi:hypothetical protein
MILEMQLERAERITVSEDRYKAHLTIGDMYLTLNDDQGTDLMTQLAEYYGYELEKIPDVHDHHAEAANAAQMPGELLRGR